MDLWMSMNRPFKMSEYDRRNTGCRARFSTKAIGLEMLLKSHWGNRMNFLVIQQPVAKNNVITKQCPSWEDSKDEVRIKMSESSMLKKVE